MVEMLRISLIRSFSLTFIFVLADIYLLTHTSISLLFLLQGQALTCAAGKPTATL